MWKVSKLLVPIIICVLATPAFGQETAGIDLNHILSEKRALIEENIPFTEKEAKAFWPLYDEYVQISTDLFKRRSDFEKNLYKHSETLTDKVAKSIVDDYFDLVGDNLQAKLAMLKKVRKILPETKVLKFFQLEEKIEAGLLYHLADAQPVVK